MLKNLKKKLFFNTERVYIKIISNHWYGMVRLITFSTFGYILYETTEMQTICFHKLFSKLIRVGFYTFRQQNVMSEFKKYSKIKNFDSIF